MDNTSQILQNIGRNLKSLRLSKDLQQKDVAEKSGISIAQYGRIENGLTNAAVITLIKLAEVFGVTMNTLVLGEKTIDAETPILLKDKELIKKIKELDQLNNKHDKELAHELLDLLIAKMKFKELAGK